MRSHVWRNLTRARRASSSTHLALATRHESGLFATPHEIGVRVLSGPKGIQYRIAQERRQLENARARLAGLIARGQHLQDRAALHEVEVAEIHLPRQSGVTAAGVIAACDDLEQRLREAEDALETALSRRHVQAATLELAADLRRVAAEDAAARRSAATAKAAAAPAHRRFDKAAHLEAVEQRLSGATHLDRQVLQIARSARTASTSEEARMALSELSSTISRAQRAADRTRLQRVQLAELRTVVGALLSPSPLAHRLDAAETALDSGADIDGHLRQIAAGSAAQSQAESAERSRLAVLTSVKDTLTDLGYTPIDVEVSTPMTVAQRPGATSHALEVQITDDEISLRTVVLAGKTSTPAENKAADEDLCSDLGQILTGLEERGIGHSRIRKQPAGLLQPAVLPAARGATAKTSSQPTRRKRQMGGSR